MTKEFVVSRSSTRIGLFGGGTDLPEYYEKYGGCVVNMAINLRNECTARFGETKNGSELVNGVLSLYQEPIDLQCRFDGHSSAGLGSSASATVAMIGACDRLVGTERSRQEIAEAAFEVEKGLGWTTGKQDQYASVYGGVNAFSFNRKVSRMSLDTGRELEKWGILFYAGNSHFSSEVQQNLVKRIDSGKATDYLDEMKILALNAVPEIRTRNFTRVGEMLRESWELKKKSNPATTNAKIDGLISRAYDLGAIGAKICGAGGEGHIFVMAPPNKRQNLIDNLGIEHVDYSIDFNGLEVRTC